MFYIDVNFLERADWEIICLAVRIALVNVLRFNALAAVDIWRLAMTEIVVDSGEVERGRVILLNFSLASLHDCDNDALAIELYNRLKVVTIKWITNLS